MDDVSTDGANAAKAARWAEGCRRHKAISRLVVPGFDDMVHRFGAKAVMSRRPFLPIALRVPLLAGVAIAMRDPAQTISRLRTRARSHGNQRFTEIEAELGTGSANPVSH